MERRHDRAQEINEGERGDADDEDDEAGRRDAMGTEPLEKRCEDEAKDRADGRGGRNIDGVLRREMRT